MLILNVDIGQNNRWNPIEGDYGHFVISMLSHCLYLLTMLRSNLGGTKMKRGKRKNSSVPQYDYSPADPFGSYTGLSKENDKPVQDADDL